MQVAGIGRASHCERRLRAAISHLAAMRRQGKRASAITCPGVRSGVAALAARRTLPVPVRIRTDHHPDLSQYADAFNHPRFQGKSMGVLETLTNSLPQTSATMDLAPPFKAIMDAVDYIACSQSGLAVPLQRRRVGCVCFSPFHEALCSTRTPECCFAPPLDRATERGPTRKTDTHLGLRRLWENHASQRMGRKLRATGCLAVFGRRG